MSVILYIYTHMDRWVDCSRLVGVTNASRLSQRFPKRRVWGAWLKRDKENMVSGSDDVRGLLTPPFPESLPRAELSNPYLPKKVNPP